MTTAILFALLVIACFSAAMIFGPRIAQRRFDKAHDVGPIENLRHTLKIQFKLPPDRPTDAELELIVQDVIAHIRLHGSANTTVWRDITSRHVQFDGHYLYEGLDFSDLNSLLLQAIEQAQRSKG